MSGLLRAGGLRRLGTARHFLLLRDGQAWRLCAMLLLLVVLGCAALSLGGQRLAPGAILAALAGGGPPDEVLVVAGLRLPRILLAVLCGVMLGMAGAAMQSLTRNGLADPALIGAKDGAAVAILTLAIGFPAVPEAWRPWAGMLGALAVAGAVMAIARSLSGLRFILVGVGVSWTLSAGVALFLTTGRIEKVQVAMIWLAGSLHAASWQALWLALPWGVAGGTVLLLAAGAGNVAALGPSVATGLGLPLLRVQALRLAAVVGLTAASVAAIGSLGFIGLVAPHLARLLLGRGEATLLLGSGAVGALLLLAADSLGRAAFAPLQIPAGIVLAVLGGGVFLLLLLLRQVRV